MQKNTLLSAILLLGVSSTSGALPEDNLARGKLLYTTHCISCHTAQIHWRDKKLAGNWAGLKNQVDRWQKAAGLGWGAEEIGQVSAYLNTAYYHFPATDRIGLGPQDIKKQ